MSVPSIQASVRRRRRQRALGLGATAVLAAGVLAAVPAASASPGGSRTASVSYDLDWGRYLSANDTTSSPIPITIGKTKALVVGVAEASSGTQGRLYALSLATGRSLSGWPVTSPGGLGIESTPSVNGDLVYAGVGTTADHAGGYLAVRASTHRQVWYRQIKRSPGSSQSAAVQASLAVGSLGGQMSVAAGSLGQYFDALRSSTGAPRPGFPWISSDSEFSTPAIANIYGNGKDYLIGGAEQTAGYKEHQGGHLWVIDPNGSQGSGGANPYASGANCADSSINQGVMSSPAVGRFLSKRNVGIVFGTGYDFHSSSSLPSDSYKVFALNNHCATQWSAKLDGVTLSSPALVDARGNGQLQIAEGTTKGVFVGNGSGDSGSVYLLNGSNGAVIWQHNLPNAVMGSITSANLGGGYQDLLVPTTNGLFILNGKTGAQLAHLGTGISLQNAALVTDNASGIIGITIVGDKYGKAYAAHYGIPRTNGKLADESGAWPMFHHDPQLTGSTLPRLK